MKHLCVKKLLGVAMVLGSVMLTSQAMEKKETRDNETSDQPESLGKKVKAYLAATGKPILFPENVKKPKHVVKNLCALFKEDAFQRALCAEWYLPPMNLLQGWKERKGKYFPYSGVKSLPEKEVRKNSSPFLAEHIALLTDEEVRSARKIEHALKTYPVDDRSNATYYETSYAAWGRFTEYLFAMAGCRSFAMLRCYLHLGKGLEPSLHRVFFDLWDVDDSAVRDEEGMAMVEDLLLRFLMKPFLPLHQGRHRDGASCKLFKRSLKVLEKAHARAYGLSSFDLTVEALRKLERNYSQLVDGISYRKKDLVDGLNTIAQAYGLPITFVEENTPQIPQEEGKEEDSYTDDAPFS